MTGASLTCVSREGRTLEVALDSCLTPADRESVRSDANAWIKRLRLADYGGVSMRDRFTYRGDSLWWFTELYLHKMRRFETKSLLKKVAARLVPREVIYRRKMGFGVPIGKWFRGEMKDFVRDSLLSPTALKRGIVRPGVIEKHVNEHIDGGRDHSYQIWTLLMLELWFQRFID